MRRAIATLGAFVLVGTFTVDVWAQRPRPGNTARGGQAGRVDAGPVQDRNACAQLAQLRLELARLRDELRHLEAALDAAIQSGNRERARQIMMEIRQVTSQIEDVQLKIRRLLQVCG